MISLTTASSVEVNTPLIYNDDNTVELDRRQWFTKLMTIATASTTIAFSSLLLPTPSNYNAWAAKDLSEEYRQGTAALGNMDDQAPVPAEAYVKLPSGLVYADLLRAGKDTGTFGAPTAQPGSRVNLQWVLRKSNGYFVDSSATQGSVPFIFTIGDGTAIAGVDEGVRGMKVGGVRRLLIPVNMAYVNACLDDGCPGPLPAGFGPRQQMRRVQTIRKDVPGEYVFLEVLLTRVQNK